MFLVKKYTKVYILQSIQVIVARVKKWKSYLAEYDCSHLILVHQRGEHK